MSNNSPEDSSNQSQRFVILDSNVIQHLDNKGLAEGIIADLQDALNAGYKLAISDFTYFEVINGADLQNESVRVTTMEKFTNFQVEQKVLIAAGHLGCLYNDNENLMGDKLTIKDKGDLIIAATAIMTGSLIYTFNGRHFPLPYFNIVTNGKRKHEYKRNRKGDEAVMISYFLEPDLNLISEMHERRTQKFEKGTKKQKAQHRNK